MRNDLSACSRLRENWAFFQRFWGNIAARPSACAADGALPILGKAGLGFVVLLPSGFAFFALCDGLARHGGGIAWLGLRRWADAGGHTR